MSQPKPKLKLPPAYRYPLFPPGNAPPAAWLFRYDRNPQLVPVDWPESERLAMVVVVETVTSATITQGYVLPTLADVRWWTCERLQRRMYFTVPRSLVLNPEVCPGLTPAAFVSLDT